MATEPPHTLWKLWKQDQISAEIAIGYLIQNQVNQEQAIQSANLARTTFHHELSGCAAQLKTHQKLLETLQQAMANLQRVVEGPARPSKPRSRKDTPNTDTQP